MHTLWDRDVGEEIVEQANDQIVSVPTRGWGVLSAGQTQAMIISTQHLLPAPVPVVPAPPPVASTTFAPTPAFPVIDPAVVEGYGRPVFSVAPQTAQATDEGPTIGQFAGRTQSKFISLDASDFEASVQGNASWTGPSKEGRVQPPESVAATSAEHAGGDGEQRQQSRVQPEAQTGVCVRAIFGRASMWRSGAACVPASRDVPGRVRDRRCVRGREAPAGRRDLQQRAGGGGRREDPQVSAGGACGRGECASAGDGACAGEPVSRQDTARCPG